MNQPKEQVEVPEAAVEAAAKRFHADSHADGFPYAWDDGEKGVLVCDETKDAYRDAVRPMLSDALPAIEQAVEERVRERLEAKIAEQRAYIDLLVKVGRRSEEYAERALAAVRAEIAKDDDISLAYRLEECLVALSQPHNTEEEK